MTAISAEPKLLDTSAAVAAGDELTLVTRDRWALDIHRAIDVAVKLLQ